MFKKRILIHLLGLSASAASSVEPAASPERCVSLLIEHAVSSATPDPSDWFSAHQATTLLTAFDMRRSIFSALNDDTGKEFRSLPLPNTDLHVSVRPHGVIGSDMARLVLTATDRGIDPAFGPLDVALRLDATNTSPSETGIWDFLIDPGTNAFYARVRAAEVSVRDALSRFAKPRHLRIIAHFVEQFRVLPAQLVLNVPATSVAWENAMTMDAFINAVLASSVDFPAAEPARVIEVAVDAHAIRFTYAHLRVRIEFSEDHSSLLRLEVNRVADGVDLSVTYGSAGRALTLVERDFNFLEMDASGSR